MASPDGRFASAYGLFVNDWFMTRMLPRSGTGSRLCPASGAKRSIVELCVIAFGVLGPSGAWCRAESAAGPNAKNPPARQNVRDPIYDDPGWDRHWVPGYLHPMRSRVAVTFGLNQDVVPWNAGWP